MSKVCIVDYGMGNVGSVKNALDYLGIENIVSRKREDIGKATHLILPGVGTFAVGMENLIGMKLVEILHKEVLGEKKPILGICLGMQLMARHGEEGGETAGLGWISGDVVRLRPAGGLKVPHVGWNDVKWFKFNGLVENNRQPISYYFVHSYSLVDSVDVVAFTDHGGDIAAAVRKENIFGVQFHPEKSAEAGLQLIQNFVNVHR